MKDSVIQNETYLTNEYLERRDIRACDPVVIGRHPFTRKLADIPSAQTAVFPTLAAYESADKSKPRGNELWYVLDMDSPDLGELKSAVELCKRDNIRLLCIILPENIKSSTIIHRYAEMELLTAMDDELGEVRSILSEYANTSAIVLDRLIGARFDDIGLSDIIREAEAAGAITVTQGMANRYFSALYLPDAVTAIMTVSHGGKEGNIYNATSFYTSEYELRSRVYTLLARHGVKLIVADSDSEPSYSALSSGKLSSIGWEPLCSFDDALRYTIQAYTNSFDIQSDFIRDSYSGKLSGLRQLQLDMLREVDRICRKHGIKYFLSGGSMLGAVRHGGYIPWDDDVDVAMLRPEYVKFKAVAPSELSERFSYQSFSNRNGYHFFFDRITAKDTYFASRYSDGYDMPKGISLDVFVYDNVSDSPKAQYMHWKRLMNKRLVMNVRWKDVPRKGKAYLLSKLLLPILRLRSMDSYSESYDKATRRYENRHTSRVMPPATDHIFREAMPREWFSEVVPCCFEGVDTFLPKGYDGFLKIWYGEDYMELLPLSRRTPYHDYYRLDLGSYASEESDLHFSFNGELL